MTTHPHRLNLSMSQQQAAKVEEVFLRFDLKSRAAAVRIMIAAFPMPGASLPRLDPATHELVEE
jgi:hypothetical protein